MRDDCYMGRTHRSLQDNLESTVHSMFTVPNVFGAWHRPVITIEDEAMIGIGPELWARLLKWCSGCQVISGYLLGRNTTSVDGDTHRDIFGLLQLHADESDWGRAGKIVASTKQEALMFSWVADNLVHDFVPQCGSRLENWPLVVSGIWLRIFVLTQQPRGHCSSQACLSFTHTLRLPRW